MVVYFSIKVNGIVAFWSLQILFGAPGRGHSVQLLYTVNDLHLGPTTVPNSLSLLLCVSMTTKSRVFCYVREHLSICTQKQGDIASLQLFLWKRATWQDRKCPVRRRKKSSQTKFISRNKETKERGNIPAVSVTMNWVWMSRQSSHVSVF